MEVFTFFIAFATCFIRSSTYHLKIRKNLPVDTEIFDFGIEDKYLTLYSLHNDNAYQTWQIPVILPFKLKRHSGKLYYSPSKEILSIEDNFSLKVKARSKHNNAKVSFIFHVQILSEEKWDEMSLDIRSPILHSRVFAKVQNLQYGELLLKELNSKCPNLITPNSICHCNFTITKNKSDSTFHQSVFGCPKSAIFFNPTVIQINIKDELKSKKISRRKNLLFRRKRNAYSPIWFRKSYVTVDIDENLPPNSFVTQLQVFDSNGLVTSDVQYRLDARVNKVSLNQFAIGLETGIVTTTVSLNREDMERHSFSVVASKRNVAPARCTLNVNVLDDNDNKPIFEQPNGYNITLKENLANGTQIQPITASDLDSKDNSRITYTIIRSVPLTKIFALSPTGSLYINGLIDREVHSKYTLTVVARDSGVPPLSNSVSVVINIEDINDNYPIFTKSVYNVRIKEDIDVGQVIETVSAIDNDEGTNGKVTYSIHSGNRLRKFSINSHSGQIKVVSMLDYEDSQTGFELHVRASDGGRPPKTNSSGIVKIVIVDVNDNAPRFISSPYYKIVPENQPLYSRILTVKARDADRGRNSQISYAIVSFPNIPFRIESESGNILLYKALDYEKVRSYHFKVKASDGGYPRRHVQTDVTIDVEDVNDNPPYFTEDHYQKRVAEDTGVDTVILEITARDPDDQAKLSINYQLTGGNDNNQFSITTLNRVGMITLEKKLDYNRQREYKLEIQASDGALSNTTFAYISVTDTNSHKPIFDKAQYDKTLAEDVRNNTLVLTVHASDYDVGDNARITYCFVDPTRQFSINPDNGEIRTRAALDYDGQPPIQLRVRAQDNGIPQLEDTVVVDIYLQDTNDNPPQFDKLRYKAEVYEDIKVNTMILDIHATDRDSGMNSQIYYTFAGGDNGDNYFTIESITGRIRTNHALDREYVDHYNLIAYAVDQGEPALSSSVRIAITVLDRDDNSPQFENDTLVYKVKEDVGVGQVVATIVAHDPDIQLNAAIIYHLEGNPMILRQWMLDPETGQLSTAMRLDYEQKRNYTLSVSATSNGLVGWATVLILVQDCNDNYPVFDDFEIIFNNYRTKNHDTFPFGVIGKVPAYDPDASDTLTYRFVSGNYGDLLILNSSSGELKLNSTLDSNRQFTSRMRVQVSDGRFNKTAICTLKVTSITNDMLQHSITVRVLNMNADEFLSPVMYQFVNGLSEILETKAENIYVFNVHNDTDVDREILNVSFSARKNEDSFFSSKYLQDQVYLNRLKLVKLTTKNVLPFDDNICLREPCQNYKRCTSVLTFDSTAPFVSSNQIIFRPIYPVYRLKCECPIGFTNDETCSDEIDLCYSNPCQNTGRCQSNEGGYTCICKDGFTGEHCEINLNKGNCDVHSTVCKNGGNCTNLGSNKFVCNCPNSVLPPGGQHDGETTMFCELRSRQFESGNFLMLPGITNQWHFMMSLSFATTQEDGLLFYNGRLNHEHDFLTLELIDGQVQLNFSTGQSWNTVNPVVNGGLNDGEWHTVAIQYYNEPKPGALPFGVLNLRGPSSNKIAVVTVDPKSCDYVIASNWNSTLGSYTCSKKVKQGGGKNSLDLTSPLLLGGVPDLPEDFQVHSRSFEGCLRDLYINGHLIDLASYIANNGSQPGCPGKRNQCESSCYNNGVCHSKYNAYSCKCKDGYTGKRCAYQNNFLIQLNGVGCLSYSDVGEISAFAIPWNEMLLFRTRQESGILLHIAVLNKLSVDIKIDEGYLFYITEISNTIKQLPLMKMKVNDGEWHQLDVTWSSLSSNRVRIAMILDDGVEQAHIDVSSAQLKRMKITTVYIGGKVVTVAGRSQVVSPYKGCLQNIGIGPGSSIHKLSVNKLIKLHGANYKTKCTSGNKCNQLPCPINSICVPEWGGYQCKCANGYIGDTCTSVCQLNLCKNDGVCVNDPNSEHGYRCQCRAKFYGKTCESQYTETCPPGWFGSIICAPCNCSHTDNFDSECDKKTGQCYCKKYHYHVSKSNTCKACDCYIHGSKRLNCTDETGQCSCKYSVIGKKCDSCDGEFAEVSDTGCKVFYSKCPRSLDNGIIWPRTNLKQRVPIKCPNGAHGVATRYCDGVKSWLKADFSNCINPVYQDMGAEISDIATNKTKLTTRKCLILASDLYQACLTTPNPYEKDVFNSFELTTQLLNYQSKQHSFGLASALDSTFNDNLVFVTSAMLNNNTLHYWIKQIKNSVSKEPNSTTQSPRSKFSKLSAPYLVESWEKYSATLLQNLDQIYYDNCRVTSDNVNLDINTVKKGVGNQGYEYQLNQKNSVSSDVTVKLPSYIFINPLNSNNASLGGTSTNLGIVTYKNINQIFPKSFENDRTFRIPKSPTINSVVVSVQVHKNQDSYDRNYDNKGMLKYLQEPVEVTFKLLKPHTIEPQCVFWNFTARSSGGDEGGWSLRGCTRSSSNSTHVTCHCYHLTTFAVLTDAEVSSVSDTVSVQIASVSGVCIALLLLIFTLATTYILPGHCSIRSYINRNICLSLFLCNVVYLVGIQHSWDIYWCMALAVGLHFLLLSTFAWVFVDGLHLYRGLIEKRDVNRGHMRIYYLIGWVLPAIVTALSVGLDAKSYGNSQFCWISFNDLFIWSFAAPTALCCASYIVLFLMSFQVYLSSKHSDEKRRKVVFEMKSSFFVDPVIMVTWIFAVFALNFNSQIYFFLFSAVNIIQAVLVFCFYCVLNKEIRERYQKYQRKKARKRDGHNTTTQILLNPSMGRTPESSMRDGVLPRFDKSTSEATSNRSHIIHSMQPASPDLTNMELSESDSENDSCDSDSDSSISLGSSSDGDAEVERNTYRNIRNTRPGNHQNYARANGGRVNGGRANGGRRVAREGSDLPLIKTRGNGVLRNNGSPHQYLENVSDGSLSDGSNETGV